MTEYHTDLRENYINCTEIRESNFNSNYNFFEIYELENIKKIQLNLNKDDGFAPAEGSGILILESEEHAIKRGANFYI